MGKIDTIKAIEKSKEKINPLYDMMFSDGIAIEEISKSSWDLLHNGFKFGYMQGRKAAIKEMKEEMKKL